jgi:hypothetical protein
MTNSNNLTNNSGQGPSTPVLDIVSKRFNWGAFLLNWIWGLGNKTYITLIIFLLGFIPFVGILAIFGCQIWFGIKGNEWAWQNKKWNSIEHFHAVQKKWAVAGLICSVIGIILSIIMCILIFIPSMFIENQTSAQNEAMIKKSVAAITEISRMNESQGIKCNGSPEELANCFAKNANTTNHTDGRVMTADQTIWSFAGDGTCAKAGDCSVMITNNKGMLEIIPLSLENGYLKVHAEDILTKY